MYIRISICYVVAGLNVGSRGPSMISSYIRARDCTGRTSRSAREIVLDVRRASTVVLVEVVLDRLVVSGILFHLVISPAVYTCVYQCEFRYLVCNRVRLPNIRILDNQTLDS